MVKYCAGLLEDALYEKWMMNDKKARNLLILVCKIYIKDTKGR